MNQPSERRDTKRVPIRVLVNCLPSSMSTKRNGHEMHGWEMWAKNLGDDGVGLKWSLAWSTLRCLHCLKLAKEGKTTRAKEFCQCDSPAKKLKQGEEIVLDGLVYDHSGSQPMRGRIQWVREDKQGRTAEFGIYVTTPEHREYFRTLESV